MGGLLKELPSYSKRTQTVTADSLREPYGIGGLKLLAACKASLSAVLLLQRGLCLIFSFDRSSFLGYMSSNCTRSYAKKISVENL